MATALDVITERGIAGTTYRAVAEAADVPLGSVTYHFPSLDALMTEAFMRYAAAQADLFDARLAKVASNEELVDALADTVAGQYLADRRQLVIAYELYLAAARSPALRDVTHFWMGRSRKALGRLLDPMQSRAVDALLEGLILHTFLEKEPMSRRKIREAFARLLRG